MPLSQAQKNYALYLAAAANKITDVKLYLSDGAQVVDMAKNGDYSITKINPYTYYDRDGASHALPLQSALHYALVSKNIEMIALLAQSALKTNTITSGLIHYANVLDTQGHCAKYLTALTHPEQTLTALRAEAEKMAEKTQEMNVFHHVKLEALTFKNDQQDKAIETLNEAIARTYVEAQKLFDSAGIFTYGMKDKARNIIKQLQHLHHHFQNIEPKPTVPQYYENASSGNTLTELVQKKRTPNPFVMYSRSWNHLQQVTPEIRQLAESKTQELNCRR